MKESNIRELVQISLNFLTIFALLQFCNQERISETLS